MKDSTYTVAGQMYCVERHYYRVSLRMPLRPDYEVNPTKPVLSSSGLIERDTVAGKTSVWIKGGRSRRRWTTCLGPPSAQNKAMYSLRVIQTKNTKVDMSCSRQMIFGYEI